METASKNRELLHSQWTSKQLCFNKAFKHKTAACLTRGTAAKAWKTNPLTAHCWLGSLPRSLPLKAAALRWWAKHAISPKPRFTPCPASGWTLCAASLEQEKTEIDFPWRKPQWLTNPRRDQCSTPHLFAMNHLRMQHMRFIQYLLACYAELPDCLSSCKKQDKGEVTKSRSERKNYEEVTSQSPLRSHVEQAFMFL